MLMKTCTRCKICKPLEDFSKSSRNKSNGRQPKCRACYVLYCKENADHIRAKTAEKHAANPQENRDRANAWAKANKDKRKVIRERWLAKNKEKMDAMRKAWTEANPARCASNTRKYQASKRSAVPPWSTPKSMVPFYKEARRLTKETGVAHHVDHIVPIISKRVCGLHCAANLQVLVGSENVRKGNRNWPDCP